MRTPVFQLNTRSPNSSRSPWQAMQQQGARIAAALLLGAAVGSVQAQAYPAKPVRVVVAFTAGGSTDILTRLVSQQLIREGADPVGGIPAQFAQFV